MLVLLFILLSILKYNFSFIKTCNQRNSITKYNNNNKFNILSAFADDRNKQLELRTEKWAKQLGLVPGYGGYWPGDPNAIKYQVTLKTKTNELYTCMVPSDRYIFFYFEEQGIDLPIINKVRMCRQGCCTICAGKVLEGKSKMDTPLGLLKEMRNEGYILTCTTCPKSDMIIELQDEDEMYIKQWSEGFEGGGVEWGGFVPDDD